MQQVRKQLEGLPNFNSWEAMSKRVKADTECYRRLCGDHFREISDPFEVFLTFQKYMPAHNLECERSISLEHLNILPFTYGGKPHPYIVSGLKISTEQRLQINALLVALADSSLKFRINSPEPEDNASRSVVSLLRFCNSPQVLEALLDKLPTHRCPAPCAKSTPEALAKAKSLYSWTSDSWEYAMDQELRHVRSDIGDVLQYFSAACNNTLISQEESELDKDEQRFANDVHYNHIRVYLRSPECEKEVDVTREIIDVLAQYGSCSRPSRMEMFKEMYLKVELFRAISLAAKNGTLEDLTQREVFINTEDSDEFHAFRQEIERRTSKPWFAA